MLCLLTEVTFKQFEGVARSYVDLCAGKRLQGFPNSVKGLRIENFAEGEFFYWLLGT